MGNEKKAKDLSTLSVEELVAELQSTQAQLKTLSDTDSENSSLKADLKVAGQHLLELQTANDDLKQSVEAVKKQHAELQSENEDLQKSVEVAKDEIAQLQQENEALKSKIAGEEKAGPETFELDGVTYEILGPASIPGIGKRTALEIASDTAAQAILISKNSGIIREKK